MEKGEQMYRELIRYTTAAELCRWHAILSGVQLAYQHGCDCEHVMYLADQGQQNEAEDRWAEVMFEKILKFLRSGQLAMPVFQDMVKVVTDEMAARNIQVKVIDVVTPDVETVH